MERFTAGDNIFQSRELFNVVNEALSDSNVCPDCNIAMETQGDEYVCSQCKRIVQHVDCHLTSELVYGAARNRSYGTSDPMRAQRNNVYEHLVAHREKYLQVVAARHSIPYVANCSLVDDAKELSALAPSMPILARVAKIYNEIQCKAASKGTPFVRRGEVKNEILAVLLFMECDKSEQRSKREITEMMGLRTEGFSRGHEQLLVQASEGNFASDCDDEICENRIKSYYGRTLGVIIDAEFSDEIAAACDVSGPAIAQLRDTIHEFNLRFIRSIIKSALASSTGVQSQLQSKIVGTIWFVVRAMNYQITAPQLDKMSGGIKKGTFMKFAQIIHRRKALRFIAKKTFRHLRDRDAYAAFRATL